jgi:hypothetical protein
MNPYKSIALICCYLGKLPWYLDYFLHSCKYNPSVDFFLITDDRRQFFDLPTNVKIICMDPEQIRALASQKLGFGVSVPNGYKLCDFKPAYGIIFENIVSEYDFWGHCDIDIIFGDIREFITDELLNEYDLISVRPDWLTGCFLLYRNTHKINTLFQQSKDYRKVFSNDKHFCFDETNFMHDEFSDGKSYEEISSEIESMMHVVKKLEARGYLKPYFDLHIIEGLPGKLKWQNGKMYYRGKYEILLYHMIFFKTRYKPSLYLAQIPNNFMISPTRIYRRGTSSLPAT